MLTRFLCIVFLFGTINYAFALKTYNADEAVSLGLIELTIQGSSNSTHYLAPIQVNLKNNTDQALKIVIPNGSLFKAEDASYQNFVVTQEAILALTPKGNMTHPIKSMCIESYDSPPDESNFYTLSFTDNRQIKSFCSFIEKEEYFEPDAQFVMWDISDGYYNGYNVDSFALNDEGLVDIYYKNQDALYELAELDDEKPYEAPAPVLEVYGEFTLDLGSQKNIHIAMFNANDLLVKELYKDPECPKGLQHLDYSFNSLEFTEDVYYVKVVMNHEVVMQREIRMN